MDIKTYKDKVIVLFKEGTPTEKQWQEMAECVLIQSESNNYTTVDIDKMIDSD